MIRKTHGDFYGFDLTSNKSISFEECMQICLDSCFCLSFTYKAGEGLCYTKDRLYNGQVYPYFPGDKYVKHPKSLQDLQPPDIPVLPYEFQQSMLQQNNSIEKLRMNILASLHISRL